MTAPAGKSVAAAIAIECRRLGKELGQLEIGLIAFANGQIDQRALITEMQAIDATQQTLEDLARMLDVMSKGEPVDPLKTDQVLAAIRQVSVRNRLIQLAGRSDRTGHKEATTSANASSEEEIDLW